MKWGEIELIDRETPRKKSWVSLCIGVAGAAALLLFVVFVWGKIAAPQGDIPEPVFAELIPQGARLITESVTPVQWKEGLPAHDEQGYLVAYSRYTTTDRVYLSLVRWDSDEHHYKRNGDLSLAAGETLAHNVRDVAKDTISERGPDIFLLVADIGDENYEGVFIAMMDGGVVRLLRKVDREGVTMTAMFRRDIIAAEDAATFRVDDVDGDGVKEAIEESSDRTSVYRFKNNIFVYDQDLSIVMTVRDTLFPEPGI